jgi:hypothetical protein
MSGGGGGMVARALGGQAPAQAPTQDGARYSAPQTANPYQSAFNGQQAPQQMQQRFMSPLVQQQMMRQQQPMFNPMQQQSSGLQAAMMQMMGRQNQPMMRPQMQGMPQYRAQALGYRPDLTNAQQSLNRVQPSVYKTDLDAAMARIAELEAAQQSQDNNVYTYQQN